MEKVVVPQCVADWYEEEECRFMSCFDLLSLIRDLKKEDNQLVYNWYNLSQTRYVESILAEMWLYGYEIEEKEKTYYWRKKKEHLFEFEDDDYIYLNIDKGTGEACFSDKENNESFQTLLTEKEAEQAVIEEDFNKLEKVEAD